jgi:citrate lyase subunit beta/citryl-CoA lyase
VFPSCAPRAALVVPAHPRTLAKGPRFAADELVIDLEDAIPANGKHKARARTVAALQGPAWRDRVVAVRVNAPGTPWCHEDLAAAAQAPGTALRSVVIPKVESPADIAFVDRLLDGVELASSRSEPLAVQALLETAGGIERAGEIARSSPRLRALVLGYADLAASLGRREAPGEQLDSWLPAQDRVLQAARAAGIDAIDGPHLGVAADESFRVAVQRAWELGFDGKWSIHPRHVAPVQAAFSPTAAEIERAQQVMAALRHGHRNGRGAVVLDGEMIDAAIARGAARVLARAGHQ